MHHTEAGWLSMKQTMSRRSQALGADLIAVAGHRRGLHAGKIADLLLVTRDPLRDLHVLENQSEIKLIVRNGTIYKSTL
jgi:imidazolonepropionase-like amidohydrolase